jgi:hypothetical protein
MLIIKKITYVFLIALGLLYSSITPAAVTNEYKSENNDNSLLPLWIKKGDFSQLFDSGGAFKRSVKYSCTSLDSQIESIELCGYINGDIMIIVKPRSEKDYAFLLKEKNAAGFPDGLLDDMLRNLRHLSFISASLEKLCLFINTMSRAEPKLKEIENELLTTCGLSLAKPIIDEEMLIFAL